ncbi:MAG: regulator [Bacteroidetes bacterium]|nr:MAG: regulator [Bacteroidota bacterium]
MSQTPFTVFVVEDNDWYNKLLVHTVGLNPDYSVESFASGKDTLKALHKRPQIVTIDYRLPDMLGIDLLKEIKSISPDTEVIVISEQEDISTAVELLKLGAFDYLVKSDDIRDRLLKTIQHAQKQIELKDEVQTLRSELKEKYQFDQTMIGSSKAMQNVYNLMEKAVRTNITVMVSGETGTGKEVVAKAIHYNSDRSNQPFVPVNMAAIPADLIESELFGHEKGAFTGAISRRKGKFEEANGGTIFLDEIGEMDIQFQTKLLRVLQEREVVRVGSNEPQKIDVRIIAATNRDLKKEVQDNNFREDLFYRLFGLPIHLPPLREREKDVLLLSRHFLDRFCEENKLDIKSLNKSAQRSLLSYPFPGNIRELKSVIELAAVMSSGPEVSADDFNFPNDDDVVSSILRNDDKTMRQFNQEIVKIYLKRFDNNTKQVADALDIGQTTVYRLMKEAKEEQK